MLLCIFYYDVTSIEDKYIICCIVLRIIMFFYLVKQKIINKIKVIDKSIVLKYFKYISVVVSIKLILTSIHTTMWSWSWCWGTNKWLSTNVCRFDSHLNKWNIEYFHIFRSDVEVNRGVDFRYSTRSAFRIQQKSKRGGVNTRFPLP